MDRRTSGRRCFRTAAVATLALVLATRVEARDSNAWSTVRGDYRRSAIAVAGFHAPLHLQWVHTASAPPRPAWPPPAVRNIAAQSDALVPCQTYDRAYRVVGAHGLLYYGSSADDTVYCLRNTDGAVVWTFTTEGPVRLAPTLAEGRLFAGSDDGVMYCLDAAGGKLLWQTRAAPEDRRLPGNGRIISRWPIRAGTIADQGVVYFAAGLFPSEGVYLCALRTEDGSVVWRETADVSPQGFMLASSQRLFIPTGRTPFHEVDRASGKAVGKYGKSKSWGRDLVGGSFALLIGDKLATGPSEDGHIHLFEAANRERLVRMLGRQLIVDDTSMYAVRVDGVQALDRSEYLHLHHLKTRWFTKLGPTFSMVLAGDVVVAGGQNRVTALSTNSGAVVWEETVDGSAEDLAVCDGRLIVSTGRGRIACFGPDAGAGVSVASAPPGSPPVDGGSDGGMPPHGYAFLIGLEKERRGAETFVRNSPHRVVCVDDDAARVGAMRRRLQEAGLYGTHAVVHCVAADRLPYQGRIADRVVVSPRLARSEAVMREAWRLVKPCGGVLEWSASETGGASGVRRRVRGAPEGGGEWTHFYADAANTACSHDTLAPGPMELQWFGRPGPRRMVDRHWKPPAPLYQDGRLFLSGNDYIAAVDAFNGAVLWERDIPHSVRTVAFKNCSNMVAAEGLLYVAAGANCEVLDGRSGTGVARLSMPAPWASGAHEWEYLARDDNVLVGSAARQGAGYRHQTKDMTPLIWGNEQPVVTSVGLFAIDAATHDARWSYEPEAGVVINPTLAVYGGHVLFVESGNTNSFADVDGRLPLKDLLFPSASLVSLDLQTGNTFWRRKAPLGGMQHILYLSASSGKVLLTGTRYVKTPAGNRVRYELQTYASESGELLWQTNRVPDFADVLDGGHGEQVQHPAIMGDVIYGPGFACRLSTGEPHDGWAWHKSHKCTTLALSAKCAFSRFSKAKNPYMFDLATGRDWRLTTVSRPGCWINMIPAGGLVLIPEGSAGCTCEYPIQTSLALTPKRR